MGGGNTQQKKSSFFSFFKPRRNRRYDECGHKDVMSKATIRHFKSDEDKVPWIGDSRVDIKASEYIARFYETRVSESEVQYCSAGKA